MESALGQIGEQTFLISLECSVRAKTVPLPGRREILLLRSRVIGSYAQHDMALFVGSPQCSEMSGFGAKPEEAGATLERRE
jgi:hypothetical protein